MVEQGLSQRRALAVVRMSASALRYEPRPDQNQALRERIEARIDEHRRALRWAIADIKGQRRTTVELI